MKATAVIKFTKDEKKAFANIVIENAAYTAMTIVIKAGLDKVNNKHRYSESINSVVAAGAAFAITTIGKKLLIGAIKR